MNVIAVWWITCLIWSSVWLFIKLGVQDVPPFTFASARLLIAALLLFPVVLARRIPLPAHRRDWLALVLTGFILFSLNYGFLFWGAQYINSGLAAMLSAATPAFSLLIGHFFLPDERFTPTKFIAILFGIFGVGLISWDQLDLGGWKGFFGALAVAASSICVAIGYLIAKSSAIHLPPTVIMSGQMLFGVGPLLAVALSFESPFQRTGWTPVAIGALLYLALAGSITAFWLNYWLLRRMSTTRMLAMGLVEPLIAVLLGALILGERVAGQTAIGAGCILGSVALIMRAD